jgi:hypothetical protein
LTLIFPNLITISKMQYSTVFLTALAASGAMASHRPRPGRIDQSVTVTLRGAEVEDEAFRFRREPRVRPVSDVPEVQGPYDEVELNLGKDVRNEQLRCQILNENEEPIVILRGANTDETFADGGNGPWKFRTPSLVSRVTCDRAFVKIDPADPRLQVSVLLQDQATETGITFGLSGVIRNSIELSEETTTAFQEVTLSITGDLVDPTLRCTLEGVGIDSEVSIPESRNIIVVRGVNTEPTFGDGNGGAWTLQPAQQVRRITCDPAFKKGEPLPEVEEDEDATTQA